MAKQQDELKSQRHAFDFLRELFRQDKLFTKSGSGAVCELVGQVDFDLLVQTVRTIRPASSPYSKRRTTAEVARGYVKDDFADAFARYLLPKDPLSDPLHRYNVDGARVSEGLDPLHGGDGVTDRNPPKAKQDAGCNGVTDRTPPPWETRI